MPQPPIYGKVILSEHALDVDQRTLSPTEDDVLDTRERQEIVFRVRDGSTQIFDHTAGRTSMLTPLGSRPASGSRTS